jgi:Family of unknown function (DUF5681)
LKPGALYWTRKNLTVSEKFSSSVQDKPRVMRREFEMPKAASSKKGSIHRKLSPDNGLTLISVKQRPRGKAFAKGHSIGAEFRFKKGEPSKNPKGRPKTAKLSEAIRQGLALDSSERLPLGTNAQVMAAKVIDQAKKGNLAAITLAGDRAEGRPNVSIALDDSRDQFTQLVESMRLRHLITGPPENSNDYGTPLLEARSEEEADAV